MGAIRIHRLNYGSVMLAGRFNPPTYQDARINVFGFLFEHSGTCVLVDTGIGHGNHYIDRTFKPARNSPVDALAAGGFKPEDIHFIVNSHLHFDHCGNNALFPDATFLVQEHELDVARAGSYTVREWFDFPNARIEAISGDAELATGITLLSTPGHTPGHQSVLVNDHLIAAQAAFTYDEYQRGGDPAEQAHEGMQTQYTETIMSLKQRAATSIYFSHDTAGEVNGN